MLRQCQRRARSRPLTFAAATPFAPDLAFAARVVEKDSDNLAPDDSYVQSDPSTPPSAPANTSGYAEPAQKTLPVPSEGSAAPQPENQRKAEPYRPDKVSPAPDPRPEEQAAPNPAEQFNAVRGPVAANNPSPARTESPVAETPVAHVVEVPPIVPRPSQPVHDVTLSLTSDNQRVDVKLIDRAGELHVAVQSADPVLNSDLRASVHDLIGGLEKSGFHTETWQPGDTPRHNLDATPPVTRNTGEQQQSQAGEDPRRQGRNHYDPDYAPSRRSRSSNNEWMEQISALTGAEKEN